MLPSCFAPVSSGHPELPGRLGNASFVVSEGPSREWRAQLTLVPATGVSGLDPAAPPQRLRACLERDGVQESRSSAAASPSPSPSPFRDRSPGGGGGAISQGHALVGGAPTSHAQLPRARGSCLQPTAMTQRPRRHARPGARPVSSVSHGTATRHSSSSTASGLLTGDAASCPGEGGQQGTEQRCSLRCQEVEDWTPGLPGPPSSLPHLGSSLALSLLY
uniref:uncharacterized protein LOC120891542 n=1 Tax=Ictidomys tridecemlineatus TaxID=43179 RepID=UPI001A9FCE2E|nr:uncharacterized protein LOC120891542 [Ictidomys tridecemlineatus]